MANVKPYPILLLALFICGAAGLISQFAWQRAAQVYLGNRDALGTTWILLVFLLGLGAGSAFAASKVPWLTYPLRSLVWVQIFLSAVNGALLFAFGDALRSYDHASFVVLILPCFLMGLAIPLGAEAAQEQMTVAKSTAVATLFFVNAIGAAAGTLGCGLLLMPLLGQKGALAVGAGGNLLAGLFAWAALSASPDAALRQSERSEPDSLNATPRRPLIQTETVLAFVLGALSFSYALYLFRILALAYTPLAWIFCVVLCGVLLFWSLGVAFSGKTPAKLWSGLLLTAISIAAVPFVLAYQRYHALSFPLWSYGLIYFVPCFGFGMLFGTTIGRYARQWGRDVAVFTALHTAGMVVGLFATTFLLFKIDKDLDAWILSLSLVVFVPHFLGRERPAFRDARLFSAVATAALGVVVLIALSRAGPQVSAQRVELYTRDGVAEIDTDGLVYVDGLWRSTLYRANDAQAKKQQNVRRQMLIAVLPFLAHAGGGRVNVLNIGMGTGITARTLARSPRVESIDAYEPMNAVREVVDLYPRLTLDIHPPRKITVYWEDARSGMSRRDKQYDIITQSPLYLTQTGSSLLLSREYLQLLRSRLKEGGIAAIYCNSDGSPEQALLVRKTVSEVFPYSESFAKGYFILAADRPIRIDTESFEAQLAEGDPLSDDVQLLGVDWILKRFDRPRLDWSSSPYVITDDQPLVEHPALASWLIRRQRNTASLRH